MLMGPTRQKILALGGVLAGAIWVAVHYASTPAHVLASLPAPADSSNTTISRQSSADGMQWMGVVPVSAADKQEDVRPFAEVIAALTATRSPADALKAYQIIEGCAALQGTSELSHIPAVLSQRKRCASITDVMRRSRYDYLRTAAYAGAPGAGSDWLHHGPSGDVKALRTRPDELSVIEWKQQARALVIRDGDQGDLSALSDLMNGYAGKTLVFDADPSRELAYAIAYKQVLDQLQLGMTLPNQPTDADLTALAAKLSPEQAAWAKAKAQAIITARAKRSSPTIL